MGKWTEKSICGRTGRGFVGGDRREVAAYCGRKTQSVVQQLQLFSPASSYDKRSVTARKNLQSLCWTKGDGSDLT